MKRYFTLYIFVYFTGLWLAGNAAGYMQPGNIQDPVGFSFSSGQLSDSDSHHITGWIDIFDKGENEENLDENTRDVKKQAGVNPFLIILIRPAVGQYENFCRHVTHVCISASFIVLYHAWKFHL